MDRITGKTATVRRVLQVLGEGLGGSTPHYVVLIFLEIAHDCETKGESDQRELRDRLGLPSAMISRAVCSLGPRTRKKTPGLGLVEFRADYEDMRRKPVMMTGKGQALLSKIQAVAS